MSLTRRDKRRARFAENEADLTPEQWEEQLRHDSTPSEPLLAHTTHSNYQGAKRWFREFLEDQYPHLDVDARYFSPGTPPPEAAILKQYARYLVLSREGFLGDKLSVKTVVSYMALIVDTIEKLCRLPRQDSLRTDLHAYITNDLAKQEGLSTEMYIKGVAHAPDLTFILSKLYQPEYLNTFTDMRTVLNLTLYMVLLVDICGRGGDIARNPSRPDHMCLHWDDVQFYTFQAEDNDDFDIRVNIKVQWSKGDTLDESQYKTVPLPGLLPTSMALEDSLRLLLTLALMDGVFDHNIRTWEDLYTLRLPSAIAHTGRRIAIKEDMRQIPVLRRMTKHRLTTTPVLTVDMQPRIRTLGHFCGIENRLIAYSLRRGVAYTLQEKAKPEHRRFLMGHKPGNDRTFSKYQSKISTIDFPAIHRGLEPRPVLVQSSILLNRSEEAPTAISSRGRQLVLQNDDVRSAKEAREEVRSSILAKYPSVEASSRAGDPLYAKFKAAYDSYRSLVDQLTRRQFKEEYKQHFANLTVQPISRTGKADAIEDLDVVRDTDLEELQPPDGNRSMIEAMAEVAADQQQAMEDTGEDLQLIDPEEFAEWQMALELEQLQEDEEPDWEPSHLDKSSSPRVEQTDGVILTEEVNHSTSRLHGLPDDVYGKGMGRLGRKGISVLGDMLADLKQCEDEVSLFNTMKEWFQITHPLDAFWKCEEPTNGTYNCRFCGVDLSTIHHAHEHVHQCAKTDAEARQGRLRTERSPLDKPCEYQFCGHGARFQQFVRCGKTFTTMKAYGEHMRSHLRSMQKKNSDGVQVPTCFFASCASNPEGGRLDRDGPDFDSYDDLLAHAWSEHGICTLQSLGVQFCEFCHLWLIEPFEWRSHAQRHLEDALNIASRIGYTGLTTGRAILPRLCPFCLHDDALAAHQRIFTYSKFYFLWRHISTHLRDQTEDRRCPAFPSLCSEAAHMDSVDLKEHLQNVHCIMPTTGVKQLASDVSDGDDESEDDGYNGPRPSKQARTN